MEAMKQKIKKHPYFDTWQRWEYKHTTLLILCALFFVFLLDTTFMVYTQDVITNLSFLGILIAGMFSVSFFTAIPAFLLLISFTEYNVVVVALVAAVGTMIGDYLILKFAEEKVAYELEPVAYRFGIPQTIRYLQGRRSTLGIVRVVGAIMIASPLPDEIGIGLLGLGKLKSPVFLAICFVLNTIGLLLFLVPLRALQS